MQVGKRFQPVGWQFSLPLLFAAVASVLITPQVSRAGNLSEVEFEKEADGSVRLLVGA